MDLKKELIQKIHDKDFKNKEIYNKLFTLLESTFLSKLKNAIELENFTDMENIVSKKLFTYGSYVKAVITETKGLSELNESEKAIINSSEFHIFFSKNLKEFYKEKGIETCVLFSKESGPFVLVNIYV